MQEYADLIKSIQEATDAHTARTGIEQLYKLFDDPVAIEMAIEAGIVEKSDSGQYWSIDVALQYATSKTSSLTYLIPQ